MSVQSNAMKGSALTAAQADLAVGLPKVIQTSHGFSAGDVVRESAADTFTKAQADSQANIGVGLSLVLASLTVNSFVRLSSGTHRKVTLTAHGLGAFGTRLWLSQGTAGLITATKPTNGLLVYLGYVVTANVIAWEPGLFAYEI